MQLVQNMKKAGVAVGTAVVSAGAFAGGSSGSSSAPDFTQITSQVSFSSVVVGIMAVAVIIAGLYVAIRGARTVLGFIRGA